MTPESRTRRKEIIVASRNTASVYELRGRRGRRSLGALFGELAQVRRRIKTSPAARRSAETGRVRLSIVEVVIVGQFFSGLNIAQRDDPHLAPDLIGLAIRFAGMIDEGGHPVAVNNAFCAVQAEQIRARKIVVKIVGLFVGEVLAHVFHDQRPFANRPRGVAAVGVDARLANDERHRARFDFIWNHSSLTSPDKLRAGGIRLARSSWLEARSPSGCYHSGVGDRRPWPNS